jgi:hypothetical protein
MDHPGKKHVVPDHESGPSQVTTFPFSRKLSETLKRKIGMCRMLSNV